ncbi:hypothetical protein ACVGW3_00955, partial [Enterobacter hormaechei]
RCAYRAYGGERGRCLPGGATRPRPKKRIIFNAGNPIPTPPFLMKYHKKPPPPHHPNPPPKKHYKKKKNYYLKKKQPTTNTYL